MAYLGVYSVEVRVRTQKKGVVVGKGGCDRTGTMRVLYVSDNGRSPRKTVFVGKESIRIQPN